MNRIFGRVLLTLMLIMLLHYVVPSSCIAKDKTYTFDTLVMNDLARHRVIPVAIYKPEHSKHAPVVIINHGYGVNAPHSYLGYSFIAELLAANGYFVVSIQHELPTDSLIPMTGVPQIVRRPFWDRGADNILFVINELKKQQPKLDYGHITLIGHSNGGDMVALFPQKYPGIVERIITLDNRRMLLPRTSSPKVYSLRSSDQPADEGVLPDATEQARYGIKIIKLPNTIHNDMDDGATEPKREEMRGYIMSFMKD